MGMRGGILKRVDSEPLAYKMHRWIWAWACDAKAALESLLRSFVGWLNYYKRALLLGEGVANTTHCTCNTLASLLMPMNCSHHSVPCFGLLRHCSVDAAAGWPRWTAG